VLSGGERNRAQQTKTSGGRRHLLDEPMNDLDIESLQNLDPLPSRATSKPAKRTRRASSVPTA
jgi:hypothetical protein